MITKIQCGKLECSFNALGIRSSMADCLREMLRQIGLVEVAEEKGCDCGEDPRGNEDFWCVVVFFWRLLYDLLVDAAIVNNVFFEVPVDWECRTETRAS